MNQNDDDATAEGICPVCLGDVEVWIHADCKSCGRLSGYHTEIALRAADILERETAGLSYFYMTATGLAAVNCATAELDAERAAENRRDAMADLDTDRADAVRFTVGDLREAGS